MKQLLIIFITIITSSQINGQEKLLNAFVTNIEGENVKILDQIDKLTIIDFWATWCKPCIAQMPALEKIKKKYKNKIEIISISIDENRAKWADFVTAKKNQEHQYVIDRLNPLIEYTTISMAAHGFYGTSQQIPVVMLIDKHGEIINKNCPDPASGRFLDLIKQHL